jgi:hypothetical protein
MVPSAHDMSKMVDHLRDLPAPDAYSPRNPTEKNKGFRMVPSKALSNLDMVMQKATKVPGPGAYDLSASLSSGRSTVIANGGQVKSELDEIQARARHVPGPGAYPHVSQLRSRGSPRFSSAGGLSLIEAIQVEARVRNILRSMYRTHRERASPRSVRCLLLTCDLLNAMRVYRRQSLGRGLITRRQRLTRSRRRAATCVPQSKGGSQLSSH